MFIIILYKSINKGDPVSYISIEDFPDLEKPIEKHYYSVDYKHIGKIHPIMFLFMKWYKRHFICYHDEIWYNIEGILK